jgi:hypothetical protein
MISVLFLCVILQGQEPLTTEAPLPGRQTGPFRFSISADKTSYQPEDTIMVTSVLRNETDHNLSLSLSDPFMFYVIDVMLPAPAWLPFRSRAIFSEEGQRRKYPGFASFTGHVLKPGGEFVDKFELNKLYTMPVPGDYHIVFHFHAPDYVGKDVNVISNEIVVTLSEKK